MSQILKGECDRCYKFMRSRSALSYDFIPKFSIEMVTIDGDRYVDT
ncbi:MAG: hypothetical protein SWY16_18020 [Cyanobacteriota bacterium]|nr:hypothetical protein [Cyanobacteriota bacterium]